MRQTIGRVASHSASDNRLARGSAYRQLGRPLPEAKRRRPQLLNEHLGKQISSVTDLLSLVDPSAVWHANDAGVPAIVAENQNEVLVFRRDRYGSWSVVL